MGDEGYSLEDDVNKTTAVGFVLCAFLDPLVGSRREYYLGNGCHEAWAETLCQDATTPSTARRKRAETRNSIHQELWFQASEHAYNNARIINVYPY